MDSWLLSRIDTPVDGVVEGVVNIYILRIEDGGKTRCLVAAYPDQSRQHS